MSDNSVHQFLEAAENAGHSIPWEKMASAKVIARGPTQCVIDYKNSAGQVFYSGNYDPRIVGIVAPDIGRTTLSLQVGIGRCPPMPACAPAAPAQPESTLRDLDLNVQGYETLADVLIRAYEQSSGGKGKERHATALPFHKQPIVRGGHDYGVGGPLFQVGKKSREAFGMVQRGQKDAAVRELLGVIVYAAGAIVAVEQDEAE